MFVLKHNFGDIAHLAMALQRCVVTDSRVQIDRCVRKSFELNCVRQRATWPWSKNEPTAEDEQALDKITKRKETKEDLNMKHQLNFLATKSRVHNRKAYMPPSDLQEKIQKIVKVECFDDARKDWSEISLTNRRRKFEVLSRMVDEFEHNIPGTTLTEMKTVQQAADFFSTPVTETTPLEDLCAKSDLPENLHINVDYTKFDPDNDSLFGGKTAYPGKNTLVTSIKYRRVYKDIKTKEEKAGYYNHYEDY